MIIALYFFIMNIALPKIGAFTESLLEPVIAIAITIAGIVMIFGAVGIPISNNLGASIVNGIFRGIGYIFQMLFRAISWIVRSTFQLLPQVFVESRRFFTQIGLNPMLSNALAALVTVLVLVIII